MDKLHIFMIHLDIKAYPDPALSERYRCIDRARTLAAEGGHVFQLMTNKDAQPFFRTPVEDLDYGPYATFPAITTALRFRKAFTTPNLLYLDTDVYLNKIPEMLPGKPYLANGCFDCMIGVNNCGALLKDIVTNRLRHTEDSYFLFDDKDFVPKHLSQRLYVTENNVLIPQKTWTQEDSIKASNLNPLPVWF